MRRFMLFALILGSIAPTLLPAAPVPERKYAKPAVIDAKTAQHVQWLQERLVSCAHIAISRDKKVAELAIVRRHMGEAAKNNPKDTTAFISWLEKNFRIEALPDTKRLQVSFRDGKPEEQTAIINCVVDDFLQEQVESRRASLRKDLERSRQLAADLAAKGKMTAAQVATAEENFSKREKYIRTLPVLVERAKAR